MYIEPNSNIYILKNCPLDTSYEHTIYFGSKTAQFNYFNSLTKYRFTDQSYQRVRNGVMRVEKRAEDLYDCNYLMFQNASFGTRWFYAFIKSVEYINNETTEITFELDVMQSWFFDYKLGQCFVEREHVMDDAIGANTVPEPCFVRDYIATAISNDDLGYLGYIYMDLTYANPEWGTVFTWDGQSFHLDPPGIVNGSFHGGWRVLIGSTTESWEIIQNRLNAIMKWVNSESKTEVICMYVTPVHPNSQWAYEDTLKYPPNTYSGYTPKNNKLYTYPYCYMECSCIGGTLNFKYEYMGSNFGVHVVHTAEANPTILVYSRGYRGYGEHANKTDVLSYNPYPLLSWTYEGYQRWFSLHGSSTVVNTVGSIAGAAAGIATGTGFGAAAGIIGAVSSVAQLAQAQHLPNTTTNANTNTNAWVALGPGATGDDEIEPRCRRIQIKPEYAKICDDFFSRFGYQVNRLKVPNRNGRPQWNYVKTGECTLTGSLPADTAKRITDIYDKGITFWNHPENIGNYSLTNK